MKKMITLIAFVLMGMNTQAQDTLATEEINWMTFEEALVAQEENPKKIFMDVYTVWCGPCKWMDRNTFSNPDVVAFVNAHFYAVKFDAESKEPVIYKDRKFSNPRWVQTRPGGRNFPHELSRALQVQAYPTITFFDEVGDNLGPIAGALPVDQLEMLLKLFQSDDYLEIKTREQFEAWNANFIPEFRVNP